MERGGIEQEGILREYISLNYKKYPLEGLRKEAEKKAYDLALFDRILNELSSKEIRTRPSDTKDLGVLRSTKRDGREVVMIPVDKQHLAKVLKDSDGSASFFAPTQIMSYTFCIILLVIVGVGLANSFSFRSFTFEDQNQGFQGKASFFEIGYPKIFIAVSMEAESPFVFNIWYFFLDFFLYLLVAYLFDLIISNSFRAIKRSIEKDNAEERAGERREKQEIYFRNENPLPNSSPKFKPSPGFSSNQDSQGL